MADSCGCFDPKLNQGGMLPVAEGLKRILAELPVAPGIEQVPLVAAAQRILAQDQRSSVNVPANTNSAMDGFAIRYQLDAEQSSFAVVAEVLAGGAYRAELKVGEAVRIMTGAAMPVGADTVIPVEVSELAGDQVSFCGSIKPGQNVRMAGEDIAAGSVALSAGTRIKPQMLGLLASLGLAELPVYRQLRVAIFSTGDEVVAQGQELPENCIYDTNRYSLSGLLQRLGCQVIDLGILEDNQTTMEQALTDAAEQADMIITSGGVSMGEADYIKAALANVGEVDFWRIAMRPGRPLAFGKIGGKPFFGLPGNPVAVMVTFLQFVQPALRQMMGETSWQPQRIVAKAEERLRSREGRTDYSRGVYRINEQGELTVRSTGQQGSGILSSMVNANCLIEIADPFSSIEAGETVTIQPFGDLV